MSINMDEPIGLAIECVDGTIDCMLDPQAGDEFPWFTVTILYPRFVDGISRPEIYCVDMYPASGGREYAFHPEDDIHPKIKNLEHQLSDAITKAAH
jgi:hypothetical protein